jgi:hypothetical protein
MQAAQACIPFCVEKLLTAKFAKRIRKDRKKERAERRDFLRPSRSFLASFAVKSFRLRMLSEVPGSLGREP